MPTSPSRAGACPGGEAEERGGKVSAAVVVPTTGRGTTSMGAGEGGGVGVEGGGEAGRPMRGEAGRTSGGIKRTRVDVIRPAAGEAGRGDGGGDGDGGECWG